MTKQQVDCLNKVAEQGFTPAAVLLECDWCKGKDPEGTHKHAFNTVDDEVPDVVCARCFKEDVRHCEQCSLDFQREEVTTYPGDGFSICQKCLER